MSLSPQDFQRVNPNTGAAPIFRNRRDADITLDLYQRHQVLVRHGRDNASRDALDDIKVWPVKYQTIFHMTNDSPVPDSGGTDESRLHAHVAESVGKGWFACFAAAGRENDLALRPSRQRC